MPHDARVMILSSGVKKFLPNFGFNIAFSLIRLDSAVAPFRKPNLDKIDQANLIYQFTCDCLSSYVGETSQILYQRILQHRTHNDSTIHDHIQSCPQYLEALRDNVKKKNPNNDQRRQFFVNHFKILERNLVYSTDRKCAEAVHITCLLYTSPSPRDGLLSRMPSSA